MMYVSTRDKSVRVSAAQAITQGISADGGLFVPESLPALTPERIQKLASMSYIERACDILGDFLTDFSPGEVRSCAEAAYGGNKFGPEIAPISRLNGNTYLLELWHGPTCAFKDMALQILPHLLTRSAQKTAGDKQIAILVATSGDTGKAALEGFRDVPGTRIIVFYPRDGVSNIQKLQMTTQRGGNVAVCGVEGNFDDTQTAVKAIFTDKSLHAALEQKNIMFSSANSINWGRLVPQIVYYIGAYCDLAKNGEIAPGDPVNIAVPTGNFGNILAAYYAKRMGLPVARLICASNRNNVLTDFIRTGRYDKRREFFATASPSMDILISSNLERLLFDLVGRDDAAVRELMRSLAEEGFYDVPDSVRAALGESFWGGFCTEEETAATIRETFDKYSYLCDTHTAVGLKVRGDYLDETGDDTKTIVASTASPFKFAGSILEAVRPGSGIRDEFRQARLLAEISGMDVPPQILELESMPPRLGDCCGKEDMRRFVCEQLGI